MNWLTLMRWLSSAWMARSRPDRDPHTRPTIGEPDSDATYAAVKALPSIIPSTEMLTAGASASSSPSARKQQHREASGALSTSATSFMSLSSWARGHVRALFNSALDVARAPA